MVHTLQIACVIFLSGVLSVMFVDSMQSYEKKNVSWKDILETFVWCLAILALAFLFRTGTW